MKNWIRIFLVCFVLVGGTAFFAYQSLNQFNNALDNLIASSFTIAKIPPIETIATLATSTDLKPSFVFPKKCQ